jgi:hypothetical protein
VSGKPLARGAEMLWPAGAMEAAVGIFSRRLNRVEMQSFLDFAESVFRQGARSATASTDTETQYVIDWQAWRHTA